MKILAKNRRARYDYDITKTFVVGVVLSGQEVKSIRNGGANLKGSYAMIDRNSELQLINADIALYKFAIDENYESTKTRKLLANRREIKEMQDLKKQGNTIVPLAIGLQGRYIKVEIGAGKGKKQYDKRETIKKRDLDRERR